MGVPVPIVVSVFNEVLGREDAIPDRPERIICLSTAITEKQKAAGIRGDRSWGPVSFGADSYITNGAHLLGASTLFDHVRSEWLTPNLKEEVGQSRRDIL